MCPNCRAFISMSDRICPYCHVQLGPRAIDIRPSQLAASFVPRGNQTAIIILLINVAFFIAELVLSYHFTKSMDISGQVGILLGAKYGPFIRAGQWWRLITAGFLHGGFMHIFMNGWAIIILVTEVEQFYGTSRLIVAYIFSTITGFYLSYVWAPFSLSLGASAACFGLFGIMLAMGVRQRADPLVQAVRAHYMQWLVIGLVLSLIPGVDLAAHIGGLIGGFIMGVVAALPGLPGSPRERLWNTLAWVAVAITVYAFARDFLFYPELVRRLTNT